MNYLSSFSDSLNNAIENVGNIVAPVDNSFEDEDSYYIDEDGTSAHRPSQNSDDESDPEPVSGHDDLIDVTNKRVIAEQQEEIEFLKTKVLSLSIELADHSEREKSLHAQVDVLTIQLYELKENDVTTRLAPNKGQLDYEKTVRQLQECEAAQHSAKESCQELPLKIEHMTDMQWVVSVFDFITNYLSQLDTVDSPGDEDCLDEMLTNFCGGAFLDEMMDSLGSKEILPCEVYEECITVIKKMLLSVGTVFRKFHGHYLGWAGLEKASLELAEILSAHGEVAVVRNFHSYSRYSTVEALLRQVTEVLTKEWENESEMEKKFHDLHARLLSEEQSRLKAVAEKEDLVKKFSIFREASENRILGMTEEFTKLKIGAHDSTTTLTSASLGLDESKLEIKRFSNNH